MNQKQNVLERFEDLVGKTLKSVDNMANERLVFTLDDGTQYMLHHYQDCCESVEIEDIVGELDDLVGSPILMAEEISSVDEPAKEEYEESFTWTFYKLATIKGYVTVRWYGSSNGYYSESVDFSRCDKRWQ
jgi:hypothetical protein